jgi:hypothetical protein
VQVLTPEALLARQKMEQSQCPLDRQWNIVTYEEQVGRGVARPFEECELIHTVSCSRAPVISLSDLIGESGRYSYTSTCFSGAKVLALLVQKYTLSELIENGRRGPLHISAVGADSPGELLLLLLCGRMLTYADVC